MRSAVRRGGASGVLRSACVLRRPVAFVAPRCPLAVVAAIRFRRSAAPAGSSWGAHATRRAGDSHAISFCGVSGRARCRADSGRSRTDAGDARRVRE
jgi:hypothetical protein